MGFTRQGTRIHTSVASIRQIEDDRRVWRWAINPTLKEDEAKRSKVKGLTARAATLFNDPATPRLMLRNATDAMLSSIKALTPRTAVSSQYGERSEVIEPRGARIGSLILKDSTARLTDPVRVAELHHRMMLERALAKLPGAMRSGSLGLVADIAREAFHHARRISS